MRIEGTDGDALVLTQNEVGKAISFKVNYIDGNGVEERLVSVSTDPIGAVEKTFVVTAANGKYFIDGVEAPELDIELGKAYEFDLSDSSLEQHPFAINLNGDRYDLNVIDDN